MSFVIGFTLLACGLPLITVGCLALRFWARGRDEHIVFGAMLALGLVATVAGGLLIS